jgi:hypothetical protein
MADQVIPAAPGWRYVYWESEFGGMCPVEIVGWVVREEVKLPPGEFVESKRTSLVPLVLGYEKVGVTEPTQKMEDALVAIIGPSDELHDYAEAGAQVEQGLIEQEERESEEPDRARALRGSQGES